MNRVDGFTLIELVMVIAIIALLAALAIPSVLRSRITANESLAQATLKTISNACEMFAAANAGNYPTDETDLIEPDPPYLYESFCDQAKGGYGYTCLFKFDQYSITASPDSCGNTGKNNYAITTGAIITSAACS